MEHAQASRGGRPALVRLCLAVTAAALALTVLVLGTGEEALRSGMRTTARLAVVVFSLVFAASSLNALFRAAWSKWLLRNPRSLGLGFGVFQLAHGVLIVLLAALHPASFWADADPLGLIGGSVGYVFLLLLMATSSGGAVRVLGRRAWQALHKSGVYVLWGIFMFTYVPLALMSPAYIPLAALLVAAFAARLVVFFRRRT